ncbi:GNAT family N-acetyltransferase [Stackebrandtia nassauensis]|uniref:GCN5-related N-acetyltransferase n=1 Tax=Stackebrandtia nassauensis (strain DSM 44728 / CIP 108903 / NRRL B-16338 / NBRC 102104 / LLR-40K-21) TaxID=446470 RepID=D3QBI1_STANL|nr:GNAT family N-acetyltransferase [Stackebrandtia nassauensis]ADD42863.1 GCN5-related N-acetyltransferase [Stackebrandtia nassauensis DSM 44728]
MNDIIVRPARLSDLDGWIACATSLFREDGGTRDSSMNLDWPRDHGPDSFRAGLDDDTRLQLVAVDGHDVVGYLAGAVAEPTVMRSVRIATLRSLYVLPQHRDSGVGAVLVDRFRQWARQREADRVAVTAYASNEGALRFYQRQGLVPFHVTLEADV